MLANIVCPVFRAQSTVSARDVAIAMLSANIVSPVFRAQSTVSTRDVAIAMLC